MPGLEVWVWLPNPSHTDIESLRLDVLCPVEKLSGAVPDSRRDSTKWMLAGVLIVEVVPHS